jgi:hypothetical protein
MLKIYQCGGTWLWFEKFEYNLKKIDKMEGCHCGRIDVYIESSIYPLNSSLTLTSTVKLSCVGHDKTMPSYPYMLDTS